MKFITGEQMTRHVAFHRDAAPVINDLRTVCALYGVQHFTVTVTPEGANGAAVYRADEKALATAFLAGMCAAVAIAAMVAGFLMMFRQEPFAALAMLIVYLAAAFASGFLFRKSQYGRAV